MAELREKLEKLPTGGEMKKRSFFLSCFIFVISAIFFYGCGGGGPGSPGSDGSDKTGVILEATIAPTYNSNNVYSVDAFQDDCDSDPAVVDPEYFADHGAVLTVNARLLNPDTTFRPGNLYIEKYTIKYYRSSDSIGAPPIETDVRYISLPITPPTGTSVTQFTATVVFLDLVRKDKYNSDMSSGAYSSAGSAFINNYTAVYTFEGKNDFDEKFSFEVQADFQIGNFNYCG
jgi:hypothetical protein